MTYLVLSTWKPDFYLFKKSDVINIYILNAIQMLLFLRFVR